MLIGSIWRGNGFVKEADKDETCGNAELFIWSNFMTHSLLQHVGNAGLQKFNSCRLLRYRERKNALSQAFSEVWIMVEAVQRYSNSGLNILSRLESATKDILER